ncbi:MAG: thioredoxin family protein [Oscillospiraceae bacterium]|nr:thioredoxin family protein [Oscillospiraceae bacterium]
MIKTLDSNSFEDALRSNKTIVVDFMTDWCPYCKLLSPILEEVAQEHSNEIEVYYLNTDDHPDIADKYEIMAVPTVFVFSEGDVIANAVNPRTKDALLDLVLA